MSAPAPAKYSVARAQAPEQPSGPPLDRVTVAIEDVLADIEVERRQIRRREIKHRPEHALEIIGRVACAHLVIQLRQPVQYPALQFRHIRRGNFNRRFAEIAQQEAQRVPQTAITVRHTFQDLRPDALIRRVVRLSHPKPQRCQRRIA